MKNSKKKSPQLKVCSLCEIEKSINEFRIRSIAKGWRQSRCKICDNKVKMVWVNKNREHRRLQALLNYSKNKEHILMRRKSDRDNKPEIYLAMVKRWQSKNRPQIAAYARKHRAEDVQSNLAMRLRGRVSRSLNNKYRKSGSTEQLLGCSFEEYKNYIQSKFKDGMTWDNRSEWHIDHIRPIASFDLSIPKEQKSCFNYLNTQPLWASENHRKSSKYI